MSHHPPVACYYGEGPGYAVQSELLLIASFWGKAITIKSEGGIKGTLQLEENGRKVAEEYTWNKPNVTINNIIIGKVWSEPVGTATVTCNNGACACVAMTSLHWTLQKQSKHACCSCGIIPLPCSRAAVAAPAMRRGRAMHFGSSFASCPCRVQRQHDV